ncbi:putative efflux protein, MATE family [Rhodospirillales bacterium URHD0017]|nr:putative efflux protein, MATE family [Rhodospirillales bacterium URHD0017]
MRLAGPTTGLMAIQILVAAIDVYFISRLGTDALAAIALVFPLQMLMMNIAFGGMGGGVASSLARALGSGRHDDARALVLHAGVIAVVLALAFTTFAWTMAPWLYRLMGGVGGALRQAVVYSNLWFAGAVLLWIIAVQSSLLRGAGDAVTPGLYGVGGSLVYMPLAGVLALGIGSWPGLGLVGLALAGIITTGTNVLLLGRVLWRSGLGFVPAFAGVRLQRRLFAEILRVGLLSSLTTLMSNATAMVMAGLVGRFGVAALAGYGIGVRLEFMATPIAFGIGIGLTTMVGVAVGAGAWQRAVRAAWLGGLVSFASMGLIGWTVAVVPEAWAGLFASDPAVIHASVSYITRVAPFYCLFGLGLTLYFASQGAGRMAAPVFAAALRMAATVVGGWIAVEELDLGLEGVFAAIAVGMAVYGGLMAGLLLVAPWRPRGR